MAVMCIMHVYVCMDALYTTPWLVLMSVKMVVYGKYLLASCKVGPTCVEQYRYLRRPKEWMDINVI